MVDALEGRSFDRVLRAAIQRSGLGLERIRYRLAQRGHRVSVAALSHWQSGTRRPERRESLAALGPLEEVLDLPVGALTLLLGPRRSRGPGRAGQRRLPAASVWPSDPRILPLLRGVDAEDEFLVRLSQHDLLRVGADGTERSLRVRLVLRAARSGVSRLPVAYALDQPHSQGPEIRPVRHCSVDSAEYLPDLGYLVASLAFDRELARGDVIMVEYEVRCPAVEVPTTFYERKLRFPVHEYFFEVSFDPQATPTRCAWRMTDDKGATRGGELRVDQSHCAQLAVSDAGPGLYALHWEWEQAIRVGLAAQGG
ncbi:XRE family transcriptional regulator [Actinokineospora sp. NBRC 105648]|uniref:XRE family transcriptional regulator n=1 Tax=Actinokineospora sp. NBRC 105648 TaxID=3032206 RepID=UPI0024A49B9C|nr:XRE family transcriptional regulator [Actinokineospora sp. NBRC 105648]GLZ42692.1 hypothetical protein Acsp05_63160 [Actinokineospora sp. NBRC 105648]